jgi:hypothetical protein
MGKTGSLEELGRTQIPPNLLNRRGPQGIFLRPGTGQGVNGFNCRIFSGGVRENAISLKAPRVP